MGNHARTLHKWFEFDWLLGLEGLALYVLGKGSFTGIHNDAVTGYSDAFVGWGTMLGHCING